MTKHRGLSWSALALSFLLAFPSSALSQRTPQKTSSGPGAEKPAPKIPEAGLTEEQLPAFAASLVMSLATEARSFSDVALRPRVLARAADVLWDVDNVNARALFKRAWEEAEKGDADEVTIKTKDNPPAMVTALRRASGRDLRAEILSMMAKHDHALSEEFLAKLKSDSDSSKDKSAAVPNDGWLVPEAVSKRIQVASALLKDGQTDKALEFAAPILNVVSSATIGFLSELRTKKAEAADRIFATLLSRAEADPATDPNIVSGLSSYIFTPGLYVTFSPEGGTRWNQPDEPPAPPVNFPPALRGRFFQVAASILLRPLPPSDIGARTTKLNVIRRLLPLFEQHAPDTATALRTQLVEISNSKTLDFMGPSNPMLAQGIKPPPTAEDALEQMQSKLDRARTSRERDLIYASAVSALLAQGDERARDFADKIEDPERRTRTRQYVDFEFVQQAIKRKAAPEAIRLVQTSKLSNTQRAAGYIDIARLMRDTERRRSLDLIEEAVKEVNRIEGNSESDRVVLLIGIVNQLVAVDRVRAWEIMGEVVKEANRLESFNGENTVHFSLMTGSGVRFLRVGGENFSLTNVFRALAKDDLYRAVEVAKSFKYEAPRAAVTLAIASSILEKQK
jgi:hypothetical protein